MALLLTFLAPASVPALAAVCDPDGVQPSGAIYRICMPDRWNGGLVIFDRPVAIPEDQLTLPDGTSVPDLVTSLGFAFATTSYSTNGLAIAEGVFDVVDLAHLFASVRGRPRRTYLVGPSEGGLVTALAIERRPDLFSGGLSACGPIGDFPMQVNYLGDFRVLFHYFFPGVLPGDPTQVPGEVIRNYESFYAERIRSAIGAQPARTLDLLTVARAPYVPEDPATIEETVLGLSWYGVFATNDARLKLGGQPFDNLRRIYLGSGSDLMLNLRVRRFAAEPAAIATMRSDYTTSGRLLVPLVTLHTRGDPIIPYWHERLYAAKVREAGSARLHLNLPIDRYGHCNFRGSEALAAFALLVLMAAGQAPEGAEATLSDPAQAAEYLDLMRAYAPAP
jgi:pimeloyl-ACP methyl ester carboxylesterase